MERNTCFRCSVLVAARFKSPHACQGRACEVFNKVLDLSSSREVDYLEKFIEEHYPEAKELIATVYDYNRTRFKTPGSPKRSVVRAAHR